MKYIIISPAKNEAGFIAKTIESLVNQTLKPIKYIIVDDGSTDNTASVVQSFAERYDFISLMINNTHSMERKGGGKVVNAFNFGHKSLGTLEYDVIVKLDADLELPPVYFESIIFEFQKNSKLGLCGGYIVNKIGNSLVPEPYSKYHVRGAFKAFRKECFEEIGGFKPIWNWDSVDEIEALYRGWETKVIDLPVIHFRPTSGAYSAIKQNYRDGYDAYCMRNWYFLVLLRTLPRLLSKPYILLGFQYQKGFFSALMKKEDAILDRAISRFYNKFHVKRIFKEMLKLNRT